MRYYDLQIANIDGTPFAQYTTRFNGQTDPNALHIEFDVPVTNLATPIGGASVKVYGISLQQIGQSSDFNGKLLKLYAGMQKGLPLANPDQAGLILQGSINQAFGNWVGTAQWVEFIVVTDGGVLDQQLNLTFTWQKGATLGEAVKQTLAVAAPSYTVVDKTSQKLVLPTTEAGYFVSIIQFAQYVQQVSAALLGGGYAGVNILLTETTFTIYDGATQESPLSINFQDLVGQPTWIDPGTIQVPVVLRADISPGTFLKLPETQVTTSAASLSQYRDKSVFQGTFMAVEVRHLGAFRQADGTSWMTVINASPAGNFALETAH